MQAGSKTTPQYLAAAYVWWQRPETALGEPDTILRQILRLGTARDYVAACDLWGEAAFRRALSTAPPGALDQRSWEFWHRYYGLPMPPMPRRTFT